MWHEKGLFKKAFKTFKENGSRGYDVLRSGPVVQASLNITCDKMVSEMRVRGKVMKKPVNSVEVVAKMVVGEVFDVTKMAKKCSLSLSAMRSRLYRFADMGLIEKCSKNPVTYVVTDELMPKLQQYAAIDCDKKHNEKAARIGGGKHMTWGNLFTGKPGQTICMLARD